MKHVRTIPTTTSNTNNNYYCLRVLLAMAVAATAANAMQREYIIADSYSTRSQTVVTASKIDLDMNEIDSLLALNLRNNDDANALKQAHSIFEKGMHSGAYAVLELTKPLRDVQMPSRPVESDYLNSISYTAPKSHDVYELNVVGGNEAGDVPIIGCVRVNEKGLDDQQRLSVHYPEDNTCMVDGNPEQCFAGPSGGVVLQGYGAVDYKNYHPETDTKFISTLKWYAEEEALRMFYCEEHGGCKEYEEYEHFYRFYGLLDYGNHWIDSAFANTKTRFEKDYELKNGFEDIDFSNFTPIARNAAISTAIVAMNIFTSINRLMVEFGLEGCRKNTKDFSSYGSSLSLDSVIASWDQAASIYAGSTLISPADETRRAHRYLASSSSSSSSNNHKINNREMLDYVSDKDDRDTSFTETGSLYYHMVETLAEDFGALETDEYGQHRSIVNRKVLEAFENGKAALGRLDCDTDARTGYWNVLHGVRVPWIQGVLKATYELSRDDADPNSKSFQEQRGHGAAYLAALLPDLYDCNKDAATIVEQELKSIVWENDIGRKPDFGRVRHALEHQYQCFGITCDEVGGLINPITGKYYETTRPCGGFGGMTEQRRDSVDFKGSASMHSKPAFLQTHKKGVVLSSFFVALGMFFVSLSVLVVTVKDRAEGRPANLSSTARRLASGVISQADYVVSSFRGERQSYYSSSSGSNRYDMVGNDNNYEVQLNAMGSHQMPLQPGSESLML